MNRPRLRPYQIDDLEKIDAAFAAGHRRVLHQLPTGGGKTVEFTHLIGDQPPGSRALVLVHRDELVQQVSSALHVLGIGHGIIAPGYPQTKHLVQVGSVMSVVRRLDRFATPDLIISDEGHHAAAHTWQRIIEQCPNARVLGVTATPRRLDGKPLDDIFDALVEGPPIADLIDEGWLSPATVFAPAATPNLSHVRVRAGDYAIDQLSHVMSNGVIVGGAVSEYEHICRGAPAIAFSVDIEHSKLVAKAFQKHGWRAAHVDGETPRDERRALIAALTDGDIDILSNCGLISEGLDVPGVEAAILLRPTKSLALYLQMVGRALRPAPNKERAFVLDHAGNVFRHGLPTAHRRWSLCGKKQEDNAADRLRRCPNCGAINNAGAKVCEHCGEAPHRERPPRIVVRARRLVEALESPVNDAALAGMGLHSLFRWAAGPDGRLIHSKLERIASARGYRSGWVYHNAGQHWRQAWDRTQRWRHQQQLAE